MESLKKCPQCGCADFEISDTDRMPDNYGEMMECGKCTTKWWETFQLVDIEILKGD